MTNDFSGISQELAMERLKEEGYNEISGAVRYNFLTVIAKTIAEPMFLLLLIGATLYFLLGSKSEAMLLLTFVLIVISITIRQEYKSERALSALHKLSSPRAFVIRDGKGMRVAGRELVRDDVIVINEGDKIPADAVLISDGSIMVDESVLTGESVPVMKNATGASDIFLGTYVVQGKGTAKITAIGQNTAIGKIGKTLGDMVGVRTPLQNEADRLVRTFATFGFALCLLVAIVYGLSQHNMLNGFLAGIALAMSILPEEIPVIITIFLALGAWRISLQNVLTRSSPAVEALGSATVLCVDKTGTITQNIMELKSLFASDEFYDFPDNGIQSEIPENYHSLIEFAILASQRDPFDPMEIAIKNIGEKYLGNTEHIHNNWQLVHQYPLAKELLAISLVWQSQSSMDDYVIAAKGAPETIFDLCHLNAAEIENLSLQVQKMAKAGLRILGVARASFRHIALPDGQHDFDFKFIGLIGLADPVRNNVSESVQSCYNAGIRVIMITGDYAGTAQNIAQKIGLKNIDTVINGSELAKMSDSELEWRIKSVNIFSRILPDQKLRIVNALKANGEVVAMTGDGVNDALALKTAHIGVAMGKRGTDVAREAADLVLLDDDFSSIVSAIQLGRSIYDNIKKAITFTIAVHIPIIGLSLLPVIFGMPLILLPAHIMFLELIIGSACSIIFEAENSAPDIMSRPPRRPNEKAFNRQMLFGSALQGLSVLTIATVIFTIGNLAGYSANLTRAFTFSVLILGDIALIISNLDWDGELVFAIRSKKPILWGILGGAAFLLLAVLYIPFLRELFHLNGLNAWQLMLCIPMSIGLGYWLRFIRNS